MKEKRGFLVFVLIVSLGAFFLLSAATVSAKPIEIGYANFFPPTHWQAKLGQSWADEVEKRTNGKVKITYYPGGALLKGPKIYDGILKGITDMGMSVFAYSRGVFPAMAAFDLPMGYLNGYANTFIVNDFYNIYKPKELSKVKVLYLHAHGPGLLMSKKPVRKLEDFKGLKVRGVGSAAKEATALGAVPVSMGMGGVYEALQKGVVDATFGPPEILKGWKHAEVVKYVVKSYSVSYSTAFYVAMNMDKWNSLPKDVQKVMEEVSLEWIGKHGRSWDASDVEGLKFSAGLGNEVITFSDAESARMAEAVKPVIDAYVKKAEGKGLPGRAYVDTIEALIQKYK